MTLFYLLFPLENLHLPLCKEEAPLEQHVGNSSLVKEEPEPPHIKEEQEELLLRPEERLTSLAVNREESATTPVTPLRTTVQPQFSTPSTVSEAGLNTMIEGMARITGIMASFHNEMRQKLNVLEEKMEQRMEMQDQEASVVATTATEDSTENPAKRIKRARNTRLAVSEIMSAYRPVYESTQGEKAFRILTKFVNYCVFQEAVRRLHNSENNELKFDPQER